MQLTKNPKDSDGSFAHTKSPKMKISLFYKSYIIKASSFFIIIFTIAFTPNTTSASFFSDIASFVLGEQATADEVLSSENESVQNSQNVPILEASSIDPNLKDLKEVDNSPVIQNDLFIDSEAPYVPDVKFEKSTLSEKISVYTVEEGDTLSSIAESFDVSVNTIRWENNLSGNTVSVGKKLNILPVTGVKHIVRKGDTISAVADKYDAESEDILIFNGILKGNSLNQGDILFVPNGIIKAIVPAKTTPKTSSSSSSSSNTKAPSGYYVRPASGIITSPYGSRRGGFHYGVDIGNARGTTVVAAASGIVVNALGYCVEGRSSCGGRYGNYITIEHPNGTRTRYAHLSKISVSIGQTVSQGQKIGALGNTGASTGPHLHFEVENANGSKMRPAI